MKCEKCGIEINEVMIDMFNRDGGDAQYRTSFDESNQDAVVIDTTQNWTGFGLEQEECIETIKCPHCGKFPFDESIEIQVEQTVQIICFKKEEIYMNAIERVREWFEKQPCKPLDYDEGYEKALDDMQKELDEEVVNDWEKEIMQLKAKHACEIAELKKKYEYEDDETTFALECAKRERDIYEAKWDAVELIFGGKSK